MPGEPPRDATPTERVSAGNLEGMLRVLQAFQERYAADRAAGKVQRVSQYEALFPGFEDAVREQYRLLREEDPPVRIPSTPGPILQALLERGLQSPEPLKEIARGGMGAVFLVRDEVLGRSLAMKVILDESARIHVAGAGGDAPTAQASNALRRMIQEAQITAQLGHPGIVPIHELGFDREGRLFFTMKLVHGRTLHEIFQLVHDRREGWTVTRALQVFIRVCETLAFAHEKGVIHRDLKPSNVMVGAFGEVYVMDWGVAKVLGPGAGGAPLTVAGAPGTALPEADDGDPLTQRGAVLGTPEYMPLEQATGRIADLDRRSDIYSLGAMLYELLAKNPPYTDPTTPRAVVRILQDIHRGPPAPLEGLAANVPPELVAICRKAMEREPSQRYQTAEEFANDLHAYLEGRVVRAYRTGPLVELRKWVRRNSLVATTAGAATLLLVAGAIWFGLEQKRASREIARERDAARLSASEARAAEAKAKEQEAKAQGERRRADGLRLAAAAPVEGARNPTLGLHLAVEAAERAPGPESSDALYGALGECQELRRLVGHDTYVAEGAWSPDGTRAATQEWGSAVILWDVATGRCLHRLLPAGRVVALAWSPDGTRVATAGVEGEAKVWDAATGRVLATLSGHRGAVVSVAWAPDGAAIATGADDGTVRLWSPGSGQEIRALQGHEGPVRCVAFAPDGLRLASIAGDATCRLWDRGTGRQVLSVPSRDGPPDPSPFALSQGSRRAQRDRLAFAAGGSLLLAYVAPFGDDRNYKLPPGPFRAWALEGAGARLVVERAPAAGFAVSGDGRRFVVTRSLPDPDVANKRHEVEWWDAADLSRSVVIPTPLFVDDPALDRTGRRAVSGMADFEYQVWDLERKVQTAVLRGHTYRQGFAAWAPDDRRILTGSADSTARVWSADPVEATRARGDDPAHTVSSDGRWRVEAEGPLEAATVPVAIRDCTGDAAPLRLVLAGPVDRLDWVRRRPIVVVQRPDGVELIQAATGRTAGRIRHPTLAGKGEARFDVSRGLDRALLRGTETSILVADLATGEVRPGPDPVRSHEFQISPDGKRALCLEAGERRATIWELDPVRKVQTLGEHGGFVMEGAWSSDGKRVATAAMDEYVRVWDAATGEVLVRLRGVPKRMNRLSFGNGDRWLLAEGAGRAILWDLESRRRLATFSEPVAGAQIDRAWFVSDGTEIATRSEAARIVRRWPLDPLAAAKARLPIEIEPDTLKRFGLLEPSEILPRDEAWTLAHPTAQRLGDRAFEHAKAGGFDRALELAGMSRALRPDLGHGDWAEARTRVLRAETMPPGPAREEEIAKCFPCIERAIATLVTTKPWVANDPLFKALRGDPGFRALTGE